MQNLIREIPLANGLTFRFYDGTRRYFGDYHQVKVRISCEVPLSAEYFQDAAELEAAGKVLGDKVHYLKTIEQQGVPTEAVAETVDRVITHFVEHSLGYFESESFPRRLVQSELNRVRGRGKTFVRPRSNG